MEGRRLTNNVLEQYSGTKFKERKATEDTAWGANQRRVLGQLILFALSSPHPPTVEIVFSKAVARRS